MMRFSRSRLTKAERSPQIGRSERSQGAAISLMVRVGCRYGGETALGFRRFRALTQVRIATLSISETRHQADISIWP